MAATINTFPVVPYANFYRPLIGTLLTDADATIDPQTDKIGMYVLPAGTLTANRVLTVANAGGTSTQLVVIIRFDLSAFTYTIRNSAPTTLYTSPASPGVPIEYAIYYTGGVWVANYFQYQQTT